ncbi:hypothetical protein DIE23_37905 [Burkholderia sp. Bp9143]|uniref:hypothetical protein n=1 Tax=Burkholderia sp. Bp9143 TaxID=2184574 RepID=UPI000F59058A|nr:hypothetical protein [Burkholderia sp. Bp9143]RQR21637.1 hypothetical protein DIE23_37905 [Burkholderia sp. Bp9143]
MKIVLAVINVLAALAALLGALYWYKASQTKLPKIDKTTGKPVGPVGLLEVGAEIVTAAELNRIAACWSAVAAALGATSFLLSAL